MTFIPMKWCLVGCLFIRLVAIEILSFVSVIGVAFVYFPIGLVGYLRSRFSFFFFCILYKVKRAIFFKWGQ